MIEVKFKTELNVIGSSFEAWPSDSNCDNLFYVRLFYNIFFKYK